MTVWVVCLIQIGVTITEANFTVMVFQLHNYHFVGGGFCDIEDLILIIVNEGKDLIHIELINIEQLS